MKERGVKMGFAVGGMSKPMVEMLDEGLVGCLWIHRHLIWMQ